MTDILDELTFIQAPSARGKQTWNKTALKYLLENEKYIGDMRLQKWVSVDHISHRSVRNDSTVIPVYNVRNHHVPIIDRHVAELYRNSLDRAQRSENKPVSVVRADKKSVNTREAQRNAAMQTAKNLRAKENGVAANDY